MTMINPDLGDLRYWVDHEKRIMYAERHDDLTKQRVYAEWEAMSKTEGFDPSYDTVVDYSHVPCIEVSASDAIELGKVMHEHDPRTGDVAIISGDKTGRYLMAKLFCRLANVIEARKHDVFHTVEEGEIWLKSRHRLKGG